MEKGNDKVCDKHSENLYYTQKKVLPYLKQAIYSSKTIAQQLVSCTTNSYLVGLPAFMLQKFPIFSKNKKNCTEIICIKHLTANKYYWC